jgi:hypothetical protein
MGLEIFIALIALAVAGTALAKVRSSAQRGESYQPRVPSPGETASLSPASESQNLGALALKVQVLELRLQEHEALLACLVTEDEARHLWNISRGTPDVYESHPGVQAELRSLVRRGLLAKRSAFKIRELSGTFELSKHFLLTERGEMLLSLRKHLEAIDTREAESMPPSGQVAIG